MKSWYALILCVFLLATRAVAEENVILKSQKEKTNYAIGVDFGYGLKKLSIELEPDLIVKGFRDSLSGGKLMMTDEELRSTLLSLTNEIATKQALAINKIADTNEKDGKAFLANNKTREGIITLNSGLQYKIITSGKGKKPLPTDTVECYYRGTLIDGTEFDSSYRYGKAAIFSVNDVISGLREALQLMPVGSKWQIFIPPDLAYGERGTGAISPNATLIFEVELLRITVPVAGRSPEKAAAKPITGQLSALSTVPQERKELSPIQQQAKVKVVANKDSKLYHLPGMKYYGQVKSFHKVEFDSEADAIKAGYRKAPK